MAWVLDTNMVVFCLRGKSPVAMRRLHAVPASEVFITSQVLAELLRAGKLSCVVREPHPESAE